jgi:hypothetical protein
MAVIRIYGAAGCPRVSEAADFLNTHGASVECLDLSESAPPASVLARVATLAPAWPSDSESAEAAQAALAPEANNGHSSSGPLVVRGGRVVVSTDPASLSSLMY